VGRLYLAISALSNYVEITGQQKLTIQLPAYTPILGQKVLNEQNVQGTVRLNAQYIDLMEFITKIKHGNLEIGVRLDISNITDPHLYVTGWGKKIKVRSGSRLRAGERQVITIDKDYDTVMLVATSDQNAALFNLTLPNGVQYTPTTAPTAEFATDIFFNRNDAAHEAYYALTKPAKGDYTLEMTNATDLGNYKVELWTPSPKPTIALTSLTNDQMWNGMSPVNVTWTDSDPSNNAKISLYYDTDNQGYNGTLIATDILANDPNNSFEWKPTTALQSGNYHLYAKIDDRDNIPLFSYSQGKLVVTNPKAPAVPQNVIATPGNGTITVTWTANTEPNLISYRVYVSNTLGDGHYEQNFGVGLDTSYEIRGLDSSKTYEVVVSAINEDSLESPRSSPIQQKPLATSYANLPELGKALAFDLQGKPISTTARFAGGISTDDKTFARDKMVSLAEPVTIGGVITPAPEHVGQLADIVGVGYYVREGFLSSDNAEPANCDPTLVDSVAKGGYYMMKQRGDQYCSWVVKGSDADKNWCVSETEKNAVPRKRPETESEYFGLWDGNLQSLLAIDKVTLADYQPLATENDKVLYKGRFDAPGHVCFYFGYRLPDGTLVFNGEQTINVRIKP